MGRKQNKIEVFNFGNIATEQIIEKTIEIATKPQLIILNDYTDFTCDERCAAPKYKIVHKSKPYKAVLRHKIIFLNNLIITACRANKRGEAHLHSGRLQSVIGVDYLTILEALLELGLISISEGYVIGKCSKPITIKDWSIEKMTIPNLKVIEYQKKWQRLVVEDKKRYAEPIEFVTEIINGEARIVQKTPKKVSDEDKMFYSQYEKALSILDLKVEKQEALEYVDSLFRDKNSHQYHYYNYIIESFDKSNLRIQSVDNQNRIYHYLTSLPKKLKCLFNIKYELDIANCHPLLLCIHLIEYYNINNDILNILYNINIEEYENNIHNVIEVICNELNISDIGVPSDVLKYIYICSSGLLWDYFAKESGIDRDEVKKEVFKQIFYSHRNIAPFTEFGKNFIAIYPNVYKRIIELKKTKNLPLFMMRLESRLIRRILTECYNSNVNAINIHDAIILLDDVDEKKIIEVMRNVCFDVRISPTIHVERLSA